MRTNFFECLHIIFVLLYSDLSQLLNVAIPQVHISRKSIQRFKSWYFQTHWNAEASRGVSATF